MNNTLLTPSNIALLAVKTTLTWFQEKNVKNVHNMLSALDQESTSTKDTGEAVKIQGQSTLVFRLFQVVLETSKEKTPLSLFQYFTVKKVNEIKSFAFSFIFNNLLD